MTTPQYTTTGSSQLDLTVLQAIRNGLSDIYEKPYLLNYIFQDLLHEPLNIKYGAAELNRIKTFFSKYKVPVAYGAFLQTKEVPPFIAVRLISDVENKSLKGLAEENFPTYDEEHETISSTLVYPQPYKLYGPFSPTYDPVSGTVTLPTGFDVSQIFVGECIQSNTGKLYPVLSIVSTNSFTIAPNVLDDFTNATVVFQDPDPNLIYNFFFFDQVFEIVCVTGADIAPLFWLTGLLKFILLRYRKELLEKYNCSLSSISMGAADLLEVQDTNVQLLVQKFQMECRVEQRVLVDISGPVRGIQGTLNLQSVGDPNFTLTEVIE